MRAPHPLLRHERYTKKSVVDRLFAPFAFVMWLAMAMGVFVSSIMSFPRPGVMVARRAHKKRIVGGVVVVQGESGVRTGSAQVNTDAAYSGGQYLWIQSTGGSVTLSITLTEHSYIEAYGDKWTTYATAIQPTIDGVVDVRGNFSVTSGSDERRVLLWRSSRLYAPGTHTVLFTYVSGGSFVLDYIVAKPASNYDKAVATRNPIGYWGFQEPSGAVLEDLVGTKHGSYLNGSTYVNDGPVTGRSVEFTTGTDHATIPLDLSAHSAITVCFWLYKAAFANDDQMAMEFSPTIGTNKGWFIDPNGGSGYFIAEMSGNGGEASSYHIERYTRPSVGWHFITAVFDYSAIGSAQIRLFFDAVEQVVSLENTVGDPSGNHANTTLYIASRAGTSLQSAQRISHLSIHSGVLSQADIDAIYLAAGAFDDFNVDGALNGRVAPSGHTWTQHSGNAASTSGGFAVFTGATGSKATVDLGRPLHKARMVANTQFAAASYLVYRYVDANNHWFVYQNSQGQPWRIYKVVGGVFTVAAEGGNTGGTGAVNTSEIRLQGNKHELWVNDVLVLTVADDSAFASATRVGVGGDGGNSIHWLRAIHA